MNTDTHMPADGAVVDLPTEELLAIAGGSIDLEVPYCGNGPPRFRYDPASLVSQVTTPITVPTTVTHV
jgi:hypothetical protein